MTALLLAALASATLLLPCAHAQQGNLPGVSIDPISFRGPDPTERFQDIEIEQKLDAQVPLDLEFVNEDGEPVRLGDYFGDKPVVLSLVYFECPSLCNMILNGMVVGFDGSANKLDIGEDFEVVTVSIDPAETPELAAAKKASYVEQYHREGAEEGWHFLTGTEENIETLATAVGYRYFYDEVTGQYAHGSGIMILTPDGRISSYYLGIEYISKKLQFALMDAADGIIGPLVDQVVLLCFQYDPSTGSYGFYIMNAVRLGGILTVGAIALFWLVSFLRARRKAAQDNAHGHGNRPDVVGHNV